MFSYEELTLRFRQAKIALKGTSENQLLELEATAKGLNLCARLVRDTWVVRRNWENVRDADGLLQWANGGFARYRHCPWNWACAGGSGERSDRKTAAFMSINMVVACTLLKWTCPSLNACGGSTMSRVCPSPSTPPPLVARFAPPAVVIVDTLWGIGKKAVA